MAGKTSFSSDKAKAALSKALPGSGKSTIMNSGYISPSSNAIFSQSAMVANSPNLGFSLISASRSINDEPILPTDRLLRYPLFEEMAAYPTLSAALNIHVTYALSTDKKTGRSFTIKPINDNEGETSDESQKIATELMDDIGNLINANVPSWALIMCVFGVSYIRPHAKPGVGITSFESSYYTLPHFVKEYSRGGHIAGFTGDHMRSNSGGTFTFADPWDLIPMKIPYWVPHSKNPPTYIGSKPYNLLNDPLEQDPVETQNYGTSLLEHSYGPYTNLCAAIRSLKATRNNASKIDRIFGINTSKTDPTNAASYLNQIAQALKRSSDLMETGARNGHLTPTVINSLIPIMGDGKGSMVIDTQTIPADIAGIEDVMIHVKQLAASIGLDASMLGFSDMLSGGLGEGGFFRTAIQAAIRSQWIRVAVEAFIYRAIDIHLAYKYGKVYPASKRPYKVEFNSANTAIQEEENAAAESKAGYASVIVTILDAIENNNVISKSETFKRLILGDTLKFDENTVNKLIKELASAKEENEEDENDDHMFESLKMMSQEEQAEFIKDLFKK